MLDLGGLVQLDPGGASQMSVLTEHGLETTYLAANLKQSSPAPADAGPAPRSVAVRLSELESLSDQGLITQTEYDERRKVIIDSL